MVLGFVFALNVGFSGAIELYICWKCVFVTKSFHWIPRVNTNPFPWQKNFFFLSRLLDFSHLRCTVFALLLLMPLDSVHQARNHTTSLRFEKVSPKTAHIHVLECPLLSNDLRSCGSGTNSVWRKTTWKHSKVAFDLFQVEMLISQSSLLKMKSC